LFYREKISSRYIKFYTFMHLKIIQIVAETTVKKKIDEAKKGAFNQIVRNTLF